MFCKNYSQITLHIVAQELLENYFTYCPTWNRPKFKTYSQNMVLCELALNIGYLSSMYFPIRIDRD